METLETLDVSGRRVLVRVDLDVPPEQSERLKLHVDAILPTLRHLFTAGARVIVATHRGSTSTEAPSLEETGLALAERLECEVVLPEDVAGDAARKVIADLRPGQLVLLENLSRESGEESNDESFARRLAALCDACVIEAPGLLYRKLASLIHLPRVAGAAAMGLAQARCVKGLNELETQRGHLIGVFAAPEIDAEVLNGLEAWLPLVERLIVIGEGARRLQRSKDTSAGDDLSARVRTVMKNAIARDRDITCIGENLDPTQPATALLDLVPHGPLVLIGPLARCGLAEAALHSLLRRSTWVAAVGSDALCSLGEGVIGGVHLACPREQVVRHALARSPLPVLEALRRLPTT